MIEDHSPFRLALGAGHFFQRLVIERCPRGINGPFLRKPVAVVTGASEDCLLGGFFFAMKMARTAGVGKAQARAKENDRSCQKKNFFPDRHHFTPNYLVPILFVRVEFPYLRERVGAPPRESGSHSDENRASIHAFA